MEITLQPIGVGKENETRGTETKGNKLMGKKQGNETKGNRRKKFGKLEKRSKKERKRRQDIGILGK